MKMNSTNFDKNQKDINKYSLSVLIISFCFNFFLVVGVSSKMTNHFDFFQYDDDDDDDMNG